jgi:hypothetical protein
VNGIGGTGDGRVFVPFSPHTLNHPTTFGVEPFFVEDSASSRELFPRTGHLRPVPRGEHVDEGAAAGGEPCSDPAQQATLVVVGADAEPSK